MKTNRNAVLKTSAWLSVMALVASLHLAESAQAQATSRPPERMTYQGFIAGSDGVALGNTAPKNYDVIFRIYDGESSAAPLWGEQQTVTVDKGYFSVLLGEGAAVPGTPNAGVTLSSLFNSATASDRYVSFTVKGVGSGGADIEILPRVRLMSSPYAFLANRSLAATKIVQDNAAGTDLLTTSGNAATLNGTLSVQGNTSVGGTLSAGALRVTNAITSSTATVVDLTVSGRLGVSGSSPIDVGAGVAGKQENAGWIAYQRYSDGLDIIGAGTTGSNRKIKFWNEGGAEFSGPVSFSRINGNVVIQGINGGNSFPLEIGGFQTGSLVGLRVNAPMQAHSYQTISDRRTKDIVGTSGHLQDLETLRGVRVVDYRWKTHPNNQRRLVKGVIAQELLSVMPEAISVSSSTVPCVPVQANRVEWQGTDKPLHVEFSEGHGLSGGERIHLEVDGHRIETSVNDVPDAKSIRVSALDMAVKPKAVVLIGREVKDFLSVDYQQIYMTAISALQEVDRRLQAVDQRVQEVEKREARVADLEKKAARVENLERDMAELRKLVAGMQAAKDKTESASVSPVSPSVSVVTAR